MSDTSKKEPTPQEKKEAEQLKKMKELDEKIINSEQEIQQRKIKIDKETYFPED